MENYKKELKGRISILSICGTVILILAVVTTIWGYNNSHGNGNHVQSFLYGASAGGFAGALAVILKFILKYNSIIKDENKLKLNYIEENDERKILISYKVGMTSGIIIIAGTLISAIVSGYINTTVSLTLYGVTVIMIIVKLITKFYYRSKF